MQGRAVETEARAPEEVRRGDEQRGLDVATAGEGRTRRTGGRRCYWCIPGPVCVMAARRAAAPGAVAFIADVAVHDR
jgi:hypothetical protein